MRPFWSKLGPEESVRALFNKLDFILNAADFEFLTR
jgi:hypothetical protein